MGERLLHTARAPGHYRGGDLKEPGRPELMRLQICSAGRAPPALWGGSSASSQWLHSVSAMLLSRRVLSELHE